MSFSFQISKEWPKITKKILNSANTFFQSKTKDKDKCLLLRSKVE